MYQNTIDYLEKRIEEIERSLSSNAEPSLSEALIKEKMSHVKAINVLRYCRQHEIDSTYKVAELPFIEVHGDFYSYRLMIDNESDDVQHWKELKEINGRAAEFSFGDKILFK